MPRPPARRALWGPTALSLALLLAALPAVAQPARLLQPGVPVADSLGPTSRHVYAVDVGDGDALIGEAWQLTADVVVTLVGPGGEVIAAFDDLARGVEPFAYVAAEGGTHTLAVTPYEGSTGRYTLSVRPPRPAATDAEGRVRRLLSAFDGPGRPGVAVAYVEGGRAVWTVTAGEAAPGAPVTEHTPFHLGDVSEMLTAYAVVDLADRGRLRLDGDVRAVVPWLPDLGEPVTPDDVLTQTAGYRDVRTVFDLQGRYSYDLDEDRPIDPVTTQAELETILRRQAASSFAPGDTVRQTPTHYAAAVALVEAATGRAFGDWMADEVFAPLGMDDAAVRTSGAAPGGAAVPFTREESAMVPAGDPDPWYGGQNAYASLADLVRWVGHLRPESRDLAARLAAPDALVLDMTGTDGDRTATWSVGRGVDVQEVDGVVRVYASDVGLSHLALVLYEPDRDVGLAVLSNGPSLPLGVSAERTSLGGMLWELAGRALGTDRFDVFPTITIDLAPPAPPPAPPFPSADRALPEALVPYLGDYVSDELGLAYSVVADDWGGVDLVEPGRYPRSISPEGGAHPLAFGVGYPVRRIVFEADAGGRPVGFWAEAREERFWFRRAADGAAE